MSRYFLSVLLLAAAPLLAQQPQQKPPFTEKVDVNLVQLDAIVTDSTGNQILGLGKDDFVVRENNVAQPIDSVDYFTNRRLLNAPESKAGFNVERVHDERYLILFFDKTSAGEGQSEIIRARNDAASFVDRWMQPNDRIAVAGHGVRLAVYSDFTNDKPQIRRALNEATGYGLGIRSRDAANTTGASLLRNLDIDQMISHTGTVFEALNVLGDALRPIRGRKDVVLFSPGIVARDEEVHNGVVMNRSRYYEPMIDSLNSANVTVYPISMQPEAIDQYVHQNLATLAADTNGQYYRLHTSYTTPLRQIEKQTAGYYLISYYAKKRTGTAGFQKVDVSLRNPEFKVRARTGYSFE